MISEKAPLEKKYADFRNQTSSCVLRKNLDVASNASTKEKAIDHTAFYFLGIVVLMIALFSFFKFEILYFIFSSIL